MSAARILQWWLATAPVLESQTRPFQVAGSGTRPLTESPATNPVSSGSGKLEHLQPVIDSLPRTLSAVEFAAAKHLVLDYADVFSRSEFDLGHTDILPHRIDTGNSRPFKKQLRRHPIAHLSFIDKQAGDDASGRCC